MTDAKPTLLTIPPDRIDPALVERAAAALRRGELVAIPTETVYGLGCDARDIDAVRRVFAVKGRPSSDPLIVHVDGAAMLASVVEGPLPEAAQQLVDAFWPGPLTLVLPRSTTIPDEITSGLDTVAVRCPSHPVAAAIIAAAGIPIAAPSANRFGRISPTSAAHVVEELGDACDVVVDSGPTDRGLESTVLAVTDDAAVVLRHGALPVETLRAHCPTPVVDQDEALPGNASPGHDKRHYSPRTPAIAVTADALDEADPSLGGAPVIYAGYADRPVVLPAGWGFLSLGSLDDLDDVGRNLYSNLRVLDESASDVIVVALTGSVGLGRAIDDRLTRAASSVVATDTAALRQAVEAALGAR